MSDFGLWLANSPIGGAVKAGSGAMLVWLLNNIDQYAIPPVVQVGIIAALPVIINWINPMDERYPGKQGDDVSATE